MTPHAGPALGVYHRGPTVPAWVSCCVGFIVVALLLLLALQAWTLSVSVATRADLLPHCYRIFGTGPDVIPGPGEADPFHPEFGAMIKGKLEVGGNCLRWEIVCFNFTAPATSLRIHGMLFGNATAPIFFDLPLGGLHGVTAGHNLVRKRCFPITYEFFASGDSPELFPDVVVLLPCGFNIARTRSELSVLTSKEGWSELTAVRHNRVYVLDGNQYFNRSNYR